MIIFLAKVFEQEAHARAFMRGDIFANRLRHFKKLENGEHRGDKYEGAIMPQNRRFDLYPESYEPGHWRSIR